MVKSDFCIVPPGHGESNSPQTANFWTYTESESSKKELLCYLSAVIDEYNKSNA
jgi:hypothetical protein